MSATSSAATQQKFTNLRKRLDQLGYRQPLGVESLPLVERLFADLVHTTESLKKAKLDLTKAPQDKGTITAHIEAYKSDNAKLVKENNDLHQQFIKTKERDEAQIKDMKATLRKLEHENADLKFLNNQYVHKLRSLEKESRSKTEKILTLQEKNLHAVVQTPGGRKKNIPFRRQRMELDCPAPPSDTPLTRLPHSDDPYVADLLKVADDNIAQVRRDKLVLEETIEGLQVKIDSFRKQVETRDGEIDRLTNLLEGGRPYDVVALEARNRSNERLISHLNIQIDYLQQKNADMQVQLDESLTRTRTAVQQTSSLENRNKELEGELQNVDRMAQRLQLDKETVEKSAGQEIRGTQYELERSRGELESMDISVAKLRADRERLLSDLEDRKASLSSETADKVRLQDLLDKVQEDKKRLSTRVSKLVANEKELVLEIDRLKYHKNGVKRPGKTPNRMDQFIRGIEEERDYWKGEVDVLQKMMRSGSPSRSRSPTRASRSMTATPTRTRSPSPAGVKSPKKTKSKEKDVYIRVLEDERDHFKRECDILKALRTRPLSPSRARAEDHSEIAVLTQERDELKNLLDKFERHMSEIQANVKVLTGERDKLNSMYEGAKEELTKLRRDVIRSPKSPKTSLAAQAVLRRVENERDDAITDLRKLTTERDTLRERLKIATETQLGDRARLEQRIEDLTVALKTCEVQRDDADDKVVSLQRLSDSMEAQLRDLNLRLAESKEEASQNKATATQMRLLTDEAERSAGDAELRLKKREAELRIAEERIARLDDRLQEVQRTHSLSVDELSRLKSTINALDREKDGLQIGVDEKAERLALLDTEIRGRDREITELRVNMADMDTTIQRLKDTVTSYDHETASLRRQLDSTNEELTEVGRAREVAMRENRRLQDDLATMTRENQNMNGELTEVMQEREELKNQLQDYIVEVKRAEEMLTSKEHERSDLLNQYRTLSVEAERYETATHQLESEGSNLRLELMTRDNELRRQREKLEAYDREIQDHLKTERSYELQVSDLTKSLAALESDLRGSQEEKHGVLQDLAAVRDLCGRLESTKDEIQRQLAGRTLDYDKLQSYVDDLRAESELLKSQVGTERSSIRNMENLLHSNREKEFQTQLIAQERDAEVQLLKDRLALNESKMESLSREITGLRTRSIELESECDRSRRQLTNEKFERERCVQELRRNGLTPPGEGRASRVGTSSPYGSRSNSPTRRSGSPTRRSGSPARRSKSPYRGAGLDDDTYNSLKGI